VTAAGDLRIDGHHTVEDCGIAFGQALHEALGDKAGVRRFASVVVPLDEAAVEVVLDLAGRSFVIHEVPVPYEEINGFDTGLLEDFIRAFAQAAEAAMQVKVPPRASYLRGLMAELERLANHFGDIGAICNDASFSLMHAQCRIRRERTLRVAEAAFGHRLMMDVIVPGGVTRDVAPQGIEEVKTLLADVRRIFPRLIELYDNTASLQDRTVTTGIVRVELARQFGVGGYIGRASGRTFDTRRALAYAPYDKLSFEVPVLDSGDVNARVWIRIREVEQSLSLIDQIVAAAPSGLIRAPIGKTKPCEGLGFAEAFRGDVLVWLKLDGNGRVARCHLRDASWFQWPLLEAAIDGNIVADFPLCNKSFNCSYSGHDI
jgi:Ni,Fe-hydrogenase III large subunit